MNFLKDHVSKRQIKKKKKELYHNQSAFISFHIQACTRRRKETRIALYNFMHNSQDTVIIFDLQNTSRFVHNFYLLHIH